MGNIANDLRESLIEQPISVLGLRTPVIVSTESTVADALALMEHARTGCVVAVEYSTIAGLLTKGDIAVRVTGKGLSPDETYVGDAMTALPEYLRLNDSIGFALNKMTFGGFRYVPIVDEQARPVAVLRPKDIVDYLVDFVRNDIATLPPEPGMDITREREGA